MTMESITKDSKSLDFTEGFQVEACLGFPALSKGIIVYKSA